MAKPLKIYLDTSDYGVLYDSPTGDIGYVLEFLQKNVHDKNIIVCFSCMIIAEFLRPCEINYHEDRKKRAKFIKDITNNNCFKFINDLKKCDNAHSSNGKWFGHEMQGKLTVKYMTQYFINKSRVMTGKNLSKIDLYNEIKFGKIPLDFFSTLLPEQFDIKKYLDYLQGKISGKVIDVDILRFLCDVEMLCQDQNILNNNIPNIKTILDNFSANIHRFICELYAVCNNKSEKDLQCIADIGRKKLSTLCTPYYADVLISLCLYYLKFNKYLKLQDSDAGDTMHAAYIPYAHLWRSDKRFSNVLISEKIKYHERIVPKLVELPDRITAMLAAR